MNHIALVGIVPALVISAAASASVVSTFDTDAEGWGILNDATGFQWTDDFGNDPGAIRATDTVSGDIWYFSASDDYLGNMSSYYGQQLSWDILLNVGSGNLDTPADVMLVGGGMSIGIDVGADPVNGQWTSWSVDLDESQDWRHVSSLVNGSLSATEVTQADFQTVLANLTGLYIQGEHTNGSDSATLDNVVLLPAPGALGLLLPAMLAGRRRRR